MIGDEQRIDWNDGNEDGQIKMAFKQHLRKTPHLLTRWYNVWGVHRNASQGDTCDLEIIRITVLSLHSTLMDSINNPIEIYTKYKV